MHDQAEGWRVLKGTNVPLIQVASRLKVSKISNFEIHFFLFYVFSFIHAGNADPSDQAWKNNNTYKSDDRLPAGRNDRNVKWQQLVT